MAAVGEKQMAVDKRVKSTANVCRIAILRQKPATIAGWGAVLMP
jgi:hypothetical protein